MTNSNAKSYWIWRIYEKMGTYTAEYRVNRWWGIWHTTDNGWGGTQRYSSQEQAKQCVLATLQHLEERRQFRLAPWAVVEEGSYPE